MTKGIVNNLEHFKTTNNSSVNKFALDYDFIGNKRSIETNWGTQNYTYDKTNQLLTASNSETDPAPQWLEAFFSLF